MARHYTCDRCGAPCLSYGKRFHRVELSDWQGDGSMAPRIEPLDVRVEITQQHTDGDHPELCDGCLAQTYDVIAKNLRQPQQTMEGQ